MPKIWGLGRKSYIVNFFNEFDLSNQDMLYYNRWKKGKDLSLVKRVSLFLFTLPFMGCTTIPTSVHDERLADYVPKVTASDFNYDPMQTPIAQCYAGADYVDGTD